MIYFVFLFLFHLRISIMKPTITIRSKTIAILPIRGYGVSEIKPSEIKNKMKKLNINKNINTNEINGYFCLFSIDDKNKEKVLECRVYRWHKIFSCYNAIFEVVTALHFLSNK